jgi:membrane-bound metal-dependent hydrolase YbcI (DUF457 family)
MFVGHFAVGFATKRLAPDVSLGWHLFAALFLDALFPIFAAVGLETLRIEPGYTAVMPLNLYDIPWSHSLAMSLAWAAAFGGAWLALRKSARAAALLAAGVFSHFVLDWLTHRPEMQLWPGAEHALGLNLWASIPGTMAVELSLFAAGVALYATASKATAPLGRWSLWAFIALLCVAYLATIFGPPPPSVPLALAGIFGMVALSLWAHSFDKRRAFAA